MGGTHPYSRPGLLGGWARPRVVERAWQPGGAGRGASAELQATAHPLAQLPAVAQAVLIVGALMILVGSALIADRLTLPLLKLLEGYWSRPAFLRSWLIDRRRSRRQRWVQTSEPSSKSNLGGI